MPTPKTPTPPTPGPWETYGTIIWSPSAKAVICQASELRSTQEVRFSEPSHSSTDLREIYANAAHIVRCVNAHDKLVAALKGLLDKFQQEYDQLTDGELGDIEEFSDVKKARAALATLKGDQ